MKDARPAVSALAGQHHLTVGAIEGHAEVRQVGDAVVASSVRICAASSSAQAGAGFDGVLEDEARRVVLPMAAAIPPWACLVLQSSMPPLVTIRTLPWFREESRVEAGDAGSYYNVV